jgi:hypothetical protein
MDLEPAEISNDSASIINDSVLSFEQSAHIQSLQRTLRSVRQRSLTTTSDRIRELLEDRCRNLERKILAAQADSSGTVRHGDDGSSSALSSCHSMDELGSDEDTSVPTRSRYWQTSDLTLQKPAPSKDEQRLPVKSSDQHPLLINPIRHRHTSEDLIHSDKGTARVNPDTSAIPITTREARQQSSGTNANQASNVSQSIARPKLNGDGKFVRVTDVERCSWPRNAPFSREEAIRRLRSNIRNATNDEGKDVHRFGLTLILGTDKTYQKNGWPSKAVIAKKFSKHMIDHGFKNNSPWASMTPQEFGVPPLFLRGADATTAILKDFEDGAQVVQDWGQYVSLASAIALKKGAATLPPTNAQASGADHTTTQTSQSTHPLHPALDIPRPQRRQSSYSRDPAARQVPRSFDRERSRSPGPSPIIDPITDGQAYRQRSPAEQRSPTLKTIFAEGDRLNGIHPSRMQPSDIFTYLGQVFDFIQANNEIHRRNYEYDEVIHLYQRISPILANSQYAWMDRDMKIKLARAAGRESLE